MNTFIALCGQYKTCCWKTILTFEESCYEKKSVQEPLYTMEVDCLSVQRKMYLGVEGEQEGDVVYLLP